MQAIESVECPGEQIRLGQCDGQSEGRGLPRERYFDGVRVRAGSGRPRARQVQQYHQEDPSTLIECSHGFPFSVLSDEENGVGGQLSEALVMQSNLTFYIDIYRIEQVIRNLITNAVTKSIPFLSYLVCLSTVDLT